VVWFKRLMIAPNAGGKRKLLQVSVTRGKAC